MTTVLLNIGQIVLIFGMLFYTFLCFSIHRTKDAIKLNRQYLCQNILCAILFMIGYAILYRFRKDSFVLLMGGAQLAYLIAYILLFRTICKDASVQLINNVAMLLSLGFIMTQRLAPDRAMRQFIIVLLISALTLFVPRLFSHKKWITGAKYIFAGIGGLLLLATLILGKTSYGANLSLAVGFISFQPSELVKLLFILFMASFMAHDTDWKHVLISGAVALTYILILVASTDLGTALIFFVTYVLMVYVATGKLRYIFMALCAGAGAGVAAYHLFAHVRVRVRAWLDPWSVIDNQGYQITQSLFAIGTGGFFGLGLCRGLPTKIPVVEKDFVFSAIAEEYGLIFALCVILVCFSNFLSMMRIAAESRDRFYKLLTVGIGITYIFQCFLTIGGVTKFIPSTGVPFPFISIGGSSMVVNLILFAIVQSVSIQIRKRERIEHEGSEQSNQI